MELSVASGYFGRTPFFSPYSRMLRNTRKRRREGENTERCPKEKFNFEGQDRSSGPTQRSWPIERDERDVSRALITPVSSIATRTSLKNFLLKERHTKTRTRNKATSRSLICVGSAFAGTLTHTRTQSVRLTPPRASAYLCAEFWK